MQYATGFNLALLALFGVISVSVCNGEVSTKSSHRYLKYIFNKYGSHGSINFEGLEHLMHSLKLGGLEFNPSHTVDEHRPKNFTLPDIIVEEPSNSTFDIALLQASNRLNLTAKTSSKGNAIEEVSAADSGTEERNALDDMWNEDRWLNVTFKEMHDPKHRHPRHHDQHFNSCLSPLSVLRLAIENAGQHMGDRHKRSHKPAGIDEDATEDEDHADALPTIKITPTMFAEICPALLVQLDQRACSEHVLRSAVPKTVGFGMAWLYASVSIVLISMCGLAGVAIVPLVKSDAYEDILRFLVAVAVGTLGGDALMHLLPHALATHAHSDEEGVTPEPLFTDGDVKFEPVWLCFCAFMSALLMFTLETMLPLLGKSSSHSHGHSHRAPKNHHPDTELAEIREAQTENKNMLDEPAVKLKKRSKLSPVALMVILGDGLHNITDGMAIGAAFALDPVTGMATALAVLCHELPHELGDFALLLQTGVSIRKAVVFNIISSVLSVIGMIVGLVVAGANATMVRWIYAGTAGTFLYIGFADLVPEMRRESLSGERKRFGSVLIDVIGIFLGGLLMLVIAMYEDNLQMLFNKF